MFETTNQITFLGAPHCLTVWPIIYHPVVAKFLSLASVIQTKGLFLWNPWGFHIYSGLPWGTSTFLNCWFMFPCFSWHIWHIMAGYVPSRLAVAPRSRRRVAVVSRCVPSMRCVWALCSNWLSQQAARSASSFCTPSLTIFQLEGCIPIIRW